MTATEAERVFERFWRADPSRKRTIGGTGLGLAISLEDAALHRGLLEVWSEPHAGSCFRLTLPRIHGRIAGTSPLPLRPADAGEQLSPSDAGAPSRAVDSALPLRPADASRRPALVPRVEILVPGAEEETGHG